MHRKNYTINKTEGSLKEHESLSEAVDFISEYQTRDLFLLVVEEYLIVPFIGGESEREIRYQLKEGYGIDAI